MSNHSSPRQRSFVSPPRRAYLSSIMPQTVMDKVKLMAGMEPDNPPELLDELNDCFQLSRMQRLYGFAICVSAGLFCSFLSSLMWTRPTKFAILYTMGNILSLGSTGFLTGFVAQAKNMFKGTRLVATCVYLGAMVRSVPSLLFPESPLPNTPRPDRPLTSLARSQIMTLVAACYYKNFGLTMIFLVVQSCALAWYCLSYIPGGRAAVSSILGGCFGSGDIF